MTGMEAPKQGPFSKHGLKKMQKFLCNTVEDPGMSKSQQTETCMAMGPRG